MISYNTIAVVSLVRIGYIVLYFVDIKFQIITKIGVCTRCKFNCNEPFIFIKEVISVVLYRRTFGTVPFIINIVLLHNILIIGSYTEISSVHLDNYAFLWPSCCGNVYGFTLLNWCYYQRIDNIPFVIVSIIIDMLTEIYQRIDMQAPVLFHRI